MCVLCGKHGNFPEGLCEDCKSLIYRNNDRLQYIAVLRKVAMLSTIPDKVRQEIEEMLKHVPPFDGNKNEL